MNKPLLIIVGTIVAVVASAWHFLKPPGETISAVNVTEKNAARPQSGANGTGSVGVLPLENLQAKSPVKVSAARTVVPLKSPLAQEFEKARQLKPFYDRYAANPDAADADTKFFAAMALERCIGRARGAQGVTEADKTRFQGRLKENDPNNAQRIEAFNRVNEICEGFASVNANPAEISKLYREAAAAGNPAAKVVVASDLYREQSRNARGVEERRLSEEQLSMVRDGLASGDPFAMERAGQLLSWQSTQLADRRVGPNNDPYNPRDWSPAWQLAACDRGANCSADAYRVLNGCANQGACGYNSLEAYMQFNELPPNVYAAAMQNRATILDAIAQGRWDWLGIATGMGRTVAPTTTPVSGTPPGTTTRTTVTAPPGPPVKRGG